MFHVKHNHGKDTNMVNDTDLKRYGCTPTCGHYNEIVELHRLRELITAWADAEDNGPSESDVANAYFALRKAVGR